MLLNLQIFETRIGNNDNILSFPEGNNDGDFRGHLREARAQMVCLLLAILAQKATLTETKEPYIRRVWGSQQPSEWP